jgi:cytochrome c
MFIERLELIRLAPMATLLAVAMSSPLHAVLTFPGCTDLAASDFRDVVLVGRGTSPAPIVQDANMTEPVGLHVHTDGRVYWTERALSANGATNANNTPGRIKRFNPADSSLKTIVTINVSAGVSTTGTTGQSGNREYGLRYFTMDPNFAQNGYAYILYTPATTLTLGHNVDTMLVSRFHMPTPDSLNLASEKKLLKMPWTTGICCHQGGAMDWDAQGNLYITTGNNALNSDGFGPMDTLKRGTTGENKDRASADNQARTANTMDWRGKVLRIKPDNSDKGYSIPAGNLRHRYFEIGGAWVAGQDTNKILPEIYTFGHRNPYSIAVDPQTGWAAIAEVGPDNGTYTAARGAVGREEYNLIRKPGFYGFPYFIGEGGANGSYNMFNPAASNCGTTVPCAAAYNLPYQNPDTVFNNSPHNTGVTKLPKAIPATISNARGGTQPAPAWISTGGNSAFTGPIYRHNNGLVSTRKMPPHLHGKWILFESIDHWVKVATLNDSGMVTAVEDWPGYANVFRGNGGGAGMIDMKMGSDGMLYVLGYNAGYFASSANTRVSRIEYIGSCTNRTVAVQHTSEPRRKALMQGVFFVPGAGALAWPEGMQRVEAFDLRGKRVFSVTRTAGASEVAVPQGLGSNMLRVRFSE